MKLEITDSIGDWLTIEVGKYIPSRKVRIRTDCDGVDLGYEGARELAAILNHFADTGELPGEGTGDATD